MSISRPEKMDSLHNRQRVVESNGLEPGLPAQLHQLHSILDSLSEFVCRFSVDGYFTYVNESYARLSKMSREEMIGQPVLSLIRDPRVRVLLEDLLANPRALMHKHTYRYPDGTIEYDEWTEEPIYNTEGEIVEIQSVGRDITAAILAQEAQRQAEADYRLLASNMPDTAVFIYDHDMRFRLAEGPLLAKVGFTRDRLEGKVVSEIAPDHIRAKAEANFRAALAGEKRTIESKFRDMEVLGSVAPILDDAGNVIRGLVLVQDVTEQKHNEREALRSALEQETAALLAGFIRDTSHDLRTPLSVIVTNTYLLRRSHLEPDQMERLDTIDAQVKRLERLINELHLMSSLDATDPSDLTRQSVDLNQLILGVCKTQDSQLREKNQSLELALTDDPAPILYADESQLYLVMMNLIENAHLYSPPDTAIYVRTRLDAEAVTVQVIDQGEGIEAQHLPLIFDRFYKVDAARSTNRGGAGLGLTIVRKIVSLHGGVVTVESQPGQGSTFTLRLPLHLEATPLLDEVTRFGL
jgi:PAS domain S-box-containing protein